MTVDWTLDVGNLITLLVLIASVAGVFLDVRSRLKYVEKELAKLVDVMALISAFSVRLNNIEARLNRHGNMIEKLHDPFSTSKS